MRIRCVEGIGARGAVRGLNWMLSFSALLTACVTPPGGGAALDRDADRCISVIEQSRFPAPKWSAVYEKALRATETNSNLTIEELDPDLLRLSCVGRFVDVSRAPDSAREVIRVEKQIRSMFVQGCPRLGAGRGVPPERFFLARILDSLEDGSSLLTKGALKLGARESLGLGLVESDDGAIIIYEVIPGSPAAQAGVLLGSAVFEVDSYSTTDLNLEEVGKRLAGTAGSNVAITLLDSSGTVVTFDLLRSDFHPEWVVGPQMLDGAQYIRIRAFNEGSASQFSRALRLAAGEPRLILDLRGNPGGSLVEMIEAAGHLLPKGVAVVRAVSRHTESGVIANLSSPVAQFSEIALLVDRVTASGAEVFSEALREAGIAKVVGERTAGISSAHSVLPLSGGDSFMIRSGELFGGLDGEIPADGIVPDDWIIGIAPEIRVVDQDAWVSHVLDQWREH